MTDTRVWRIGYVPLTDAAVLVAAVERGFAAEVGLALELVAQPSWATLRDELALGHLDGAHMLAPLAVAASLGLSGPPSDLAAVFALNLNGNAITVSCPVWAEMTAQGAGDDLVATARAFVAVGRARAAAGRPFTLATVFPYSCHTYQLRRFAALGGGRLEEIAELAVVPPPRTAAALGAGTIDGFCVGSPWNSVAVAAGTGCIAALCSALAPDCPEKVLAVPFARREEAAPLVAVLRQAAAWCATLENHADLAALLAHPDRVGVSADVIARTLSGRVPWRPDGGEHRDPRYLVFPRDGVLGAAQRDWLVAAMQEAGHLPSGDLSPETGRALERILGTAAA